MKQPFHLKTRIVESLVLVFVAMGSSQAATSREACVSLKVVSDQRGELDTYLLKGESLPVIGASWGEAFSLVIRNRCKEHLLARVYVDGLNVVDGKPRSQKTSGYVLAPFKSVKIMGWRKSSEEVARFYFTQPFDSYAARRMQSTPELGFIHMDVFKGAVEPSSRRVLSEDSSKSRAAEASGAERFSANSARASVGTGHGERVGSASQTVSFTARPYPETVYRVRYLLEKELEREIDNLDFAPDPLR